MTRRATPRQRRQAREREIEQRRLAANAILDVTVEPVKLPMGAVRADPSQLVHNNTYSLLPLFYVDRVVVCRDCGAEEVWRAARQKWWYEVAKGSIFSTAVYCRACRRKEQARQAAARQVSEAGMAAKRKPT
jgi:hypothetical protein